MFSMDGMFYVFSRLTCLRDHPDREALMATLSCAMVGPMDGIELLNASRVMATCRGDGVVLKPDKPATTVDSCFKSADPYHPPSTCYIYHTYSDTAGLGRVNYLFSNDGDLLLTPDMVYLNWKPGSAKHIVYGWHTEYLSLMGPK